MICERCGATRYNRNLFCACGKLYSKVELDNVQVKGFVGVQHSTSESIDRFWKTGDPTGL